MERSDNARGLHGEEPMKKLKVFKEKCTGCGNCIEVCPVNETVDPKQLKGKPPKGKIFRLINDVIDPVGLCQQCDPAPCMEICPAPAIYRNGNNVVLVNEWECNACGFCNEICPYGAIFIDYKKPRKWTSVKCDLCQGDPLCVRNCPASAIEFTL